MSSRQARDAEANKARRAAARREREAKRTAANIPGPPTPKAKSQVTPRQSRPPEQAILMSDVTVFEPEDREGRLAILLMIGVLALLALLIIAVLKAAAT
ncbi:MAG: hypothetical protein ACR2OE_03810 [Thermomicrobiales bacterium]